MPTSPLSRRRAVLVVEDDHALGTLFLALLSKEDVHVDLVTDASQAAALLASVEYDVIILDLMMPVENGFVFLKRFATNRELLARTIVVTGASQGDIDRVPRDSVFAVVRKPFDIHSLMATVRACADQHIAPARSVDQSARRLEAALPAVQRLLAEAHETDQDLMLQSEMRRVVARLSDAFSRAAQFESNSLRAQRLDHLAKAAGRLGGSRTARSREH